MFVVVQKQNWNPRKDKLKICPMFKSPMGVTRDWVIYMHGAKVVGCTTIDIINDTFDDDDKVLNASKKLQSIHVIGYFIKFVFEPIEIKWTLDLSGENRNTIVKTHSNRLSRFWD